MSEKQEQSFEEAMDELEQLVEKLEQGDVPLEQAIAYYQEGMKLSKLCSEKLENVEKQMAEIVNNKGGTEPFSVQEDE